MSFIITPSPNINGCQNSISSEKIKILKIYIEELT